MASKYVFKARLNSGTVLLVSVAKYSVVEAARKSEKLVRSKKSDYYQQTVRSVEYDGQIDA